MRWKAGRIVDFGGPWGSGVAVLVVQRRHGTIEAIPCEHAPTARALRALFGEAEDPEGAPLAGRRIRYQTDRFGVLAAVDRA